MATRKIVVYVDSSSFYSILAFRRLMRDLPLLESHGVELEFVPVFLGGINQGSGNKPPWTLPAKASYSAFETERAKQYFAATDLRRPEPFPPNTLLPMRCMVHIKATYGERRWWQAYAALTEGLWRDGLDTASPHALTRLLTRIFSEADAAAIVRAGQTSESKARLKANTDEALARGAFGAPWLWVRNAEGREEPFFGSDRFHFVWRFLGLPWSDMAITPKAAL